MGGNQAKEWLITLQKSGDEKKIKTSSNTLCVSWLIGIGATFTITGLNCDLGIFRESNP
jgi:hypothetical protein